MTTTVLDRRDEQRGPCDACEISWVACRAAGGACCGECVRHYGATHPRVDDRADGA